MTKPRWRSHNGDPDYFSTAEFLGHAAGVDVYLNDDDYSYYKFLIVSKHPNNGRNHNWSRVGVDEHGNLDFLDDDAYVSVPELAALYKIVGEYRDE